MRPFLRAVLVRVVPAGGLLPATFVLARLPFPEGPGGLVRAPALAGY